MVDYNSIAPYYDSLARCVFGSAQREAEAYWLSEILPTSRILIVGGGSGAILEKLSGYGQQNWQVTFVEKSSQMIQMAQQREYTNISVKFVQKPVEQVEFTHGFDCIITSFFFDNFLETEVHCVVQLLRRSLSPEGLWIETDFQYAKSSYIARYLSYVLIKSMYLFFRVTSGVKLFSLPCTQKVFANNGFRMMKKREYYKGMICTFLYRRLS